MASHDPDIPQMSLPGSYSTRKCGFLSCGYCRIKNDVLALAVRYRVYSVFFSRGTLDSQDEGGHHHALSVS